MRHSPRTRSSEPKRSTMGFWKWVRNMRMKRMLVRSTAPSLLEYCDRGMRNWYHLTVSLLPLRSVTGASRMSVMKLWPSCMSCGRMLTSYCR